jgi:hypothetical protein
MYKDFKNIELPEFAKDEKVTIIKQNEFGYPVAMTVKFESLFLRDYAQYRNCLQLQGKRPRARKLSAVLIRPYENFALYRGVVNANDTTKLISDDGVTTMVSLGMCFDEDTLRKALPKGALINTFEMEQ